MRVVLIASAPPPALGLSATLARMGHDVAALVAFRGPDGRYGYDYPFGLHQAAPDGDLLFVRSGARLGPLLRAYEPEIAICASFPARIPDDALRVPAPRHHQHASGPAAALPRPEPDRLVDPQRRHRARDHRPPDDERVRRGADLRAGRRPDRRRRGPGARRRRALRSAGRGAARRGACARQGRRVRRSPGRVAGRLRGRLRARISWRSTGRTTRVTSTTRRARGSCRHRSTAGVARSPSSTDGACGSLRTSLDDEQGGTRVDCGDGPLWVLDSEPVAAAVA